MTHLYLTDYLSNYPIWPNQAEHSNMSWSRPSSPSVNDTALAAPEPRPLLRPKGGGGDLEKSTGASAAESPG